MPLATSLDQFTASLTAAAQRQLQQGEVVLTGAQGQYSIRAIVQASPQTVWAVLTAYEQFPQFLSAVVSSRVLERRDNRTLIERKDRRKIGLMPIKVKIVTENVEIPHERIEYRMVKGTLDSMQGSWELNAITDAANQPATLLTQNISARASMGPLQGYFYEVFETGLVETMTDLRAEMERRDRR